MLKKWAAAWQYLEIDFCAQRKPQISQGIRPVWSESSQRAQWVAEGPRFLYADSEDSDQTGRMPRLIWVFAERTGNFVGFVIRRLKFLNKNNNQRTSVNAHTTPCPGIYYNAFIHVYNPSAGADNPLGTTVDVNRKPLSLCPFVASFKTISTRFFHVFSTCI